MQAIGPAPPTTGRRFRVGTTSIVAFALLIILNFFPGWRAIPFLNNGMVLIIGSLDFVLAVIILCNVIYQLSDSPGVHVGVHTIMVVALIFGLTRLIRTMPFNFASNSPWPGAVHLLLIGAAVVAWCAFWVFIWQMIGLNYKASLRGH
jgi:hypothetical protein